MKLLRRLRFAILTLIWFSIFLLVVLLAYLIHGWEAVEEILLE